MIDKEKVLKGLEYCAIKQSCLGCPYCKGNSTCQDDMAKDALKLLKEQEWYMLTEDDDGIIHGLPGDDGRYLMTDGKDIWIDEYMDGVSDGIFLDSGRDIREITAWMYMPELPKQGRR